jgi:hypothetical protein
VIAPRVHQLKSCSAEFEGALGIDDLVRNDNVAAFEGGEALFGAAMSDDGRAGVLERLAPGDVIVVMMAVDQILDRRLVILRISST